MTNPRTKAEAAALALTVRAEIGLDAMAPLDPWALAEEHRVVVLPVSRIAGIATETLAHVHVTKPTLLSAALVPDGTARFIVDNDRHPRTRRTASISHEMAHVLWEHEFTEVLVTADGCRAVDRGVEEEAERLGHELLITTVAAVALAKEGWSDDRVARHYGVSLKYAGMRMNRTGARKRADYSAAKALRQRV